MTDQPRLKLGIIGAGIMGERLLRAATDHAADLVEVAAVWDAAPAALDRVAGAVPGVRRAGTAGECMTGVDCVYVATPPATHIAYADQALAAGCAVFLEKPLATDVASADAFARRTVGQRVAINFPFASSFAVERLCAWIDQGAIGPAPTALDIEVGFAAWPRPWQQAAAAWLDEPAEGGFTREVVSHFLFLARRVLGSLQLADATVERGVSGTEMRIVAHLQAGGVPVTLKGSVGEIVEDDENRWTLHGQGAVRLRNWSFAERLREDGSWAADPDAAPNEKMRPLVLRRQLEGVVRMTAGQPHALATVQEALEVQAVVESILRHGPGHG